MTDPYRTYVPIPVRQEASWRNLANGLSTRILNCAYRTKISAGGGSSRGRSSTFELPVELYLYRRGELL